MLSLGGRRQDHAAAAAPDHRRTEGADSVRRPREIHVNLVVPICILHIEDRLECLDARIGEQDIEAAEFLLDARGRVTASLRRDDLDRERVLATAFRLLDQAAPRVGSERYFSAHGSRGLTTLQRRDALVDGSVTSLRFPGKSGKRQRLDVDDADLAVVVGLLAAGRPAAPLLAYARGRRRVALTPKDVNAYVRAMTGGSFTAKDFRTLRGTILAADALARIGPTSTKTDRKRAEVLAVRATATALGNTPAVAKSSYIDPRVFARYRRGVLLDTSISPESAIRALLAS